MKRELREELGIETEVGAFFCSSRFVYPHMAVELLVYRTILCFGRDRTAMNTTGSNGSPPEALSEADFSEADKPVVRKLKQEAG